MSHNPFPLETERFGSYAWVRMRRASYLFSRTSMDCHSSLIKMWHSKMILHYVLQWDTSFVDDKNTAKSQLNPEARALFQVMSVLRNTAAISEENLGLLLFLTLNFLKAHLQSRVCDTLLGVRALRPPIRLVAHLIVSKLLSLFTQVGAKLAVLLINVDWQPGWCDLSDI